MPKAHFTWQDEKDLRDAAWEEVKDLPLPRKLRLWHRDALVLHYKAIIAKQVELGEVVSENVVGAVSVDRRRNPSPRVDVSDP